MVAKRRVRPAVSIGAGVLLGLSLWGMGIQVGSAQQDSSDGLTGPALAEALGLELHEDFFYGCDTYATREIDGSMAGWCVDEVADSDYEAWELAHRLIGDPPTELDRQVYELEMKYANMDDRTTPEAQEVAEQLDELWARQEA